MKKVTAYTDGGCKNGHGGVGLYVEYENGANASWSWPEHGSSNNRCELLGAIRALEILEPFRASLDVTIVSDSTYVVKGITEWIDGWKSCDWEGTKNVDLWKRLDVLEAKFPRLAWIHVRGHGKGGEQDSPYVRGNGVADELATRGRLEAEATAVPLASRPKVMVARKKGVIRVSVWEITLDGAYRQSASSDDPDFPVDVSTSWNLHERLDVAYPYPAMICPEAG